MFHAKASKEHLDVVKSLMACKPKLSASICVFVLEMKGYFDILESLNMVFDAEFSINIILSSMRADYNQFVLSYQMNRKETSIMELHSLLQTAKQGIKKINVPSTSATPVLTVGHNAKKIKTSYSNWKGKATKGKFDSGSNKRAKSEISPTSNPKQAVCFYCNTKGHWNCSYPKSLKHLKDEKVKKGSHSGVEACKAQLSHGKQENHACDKDWKVRAHAELEEECSLREISKEDSGSKIDLEEIQESADEEPIVNTNIQPEVVTPVKLDDISLTICRTSGMDDPNITMKEYIRLEEEKARRHGKVYNWETATYDRIWDDDEVHNLRSVETKVPAIVFDDMFTYHAAFSCEPTVSPLNDNEIDFRILFDESDDEDYTVIFDKNSFSYKRISVDDLKTDSKNDNDKVNMPSFSSPEPTGTLQLQLGGAKHRMSWMQFILDLGLHTTEEMKTAGFGLYWADIARRSQAPKKVTVTDLFYLRGIDLDDTWAWVALGPERQPDAAAGAPEVTKDTPVVDEGASDVPAPIVINSNDDISSNDDDSLYNENIEYVEASPHDSELVSLEVADFVIPEEEEIEDDNLREKLLNETNTFHNSLPEFENFYFDLEEISSGSTTTHSDISLSEYDSFIFDLANDQFPPTDRSDLTHEEFVNELAHIISPPEYDCFYFWNLPDPGELISILNFGIHENLSSTTHVNLPVEDDYSPLLAYVVWIFLAYLTYPVIPPYLYPFGNEDTIFDP
nr:hypothetical protein [Tanacetum cinerariifolium]